MVEDIEDGIRVTYGGDFSDYRNLPKLVMDELLDLTDDRHRLSWEEIFRIWDEAGYGGEKE